jgi:hypothetical protein
LRLRGSSASAPLKERPAKPLDDQLKQTRILNNRVPVVTAPTTTPQVETNPLPNETRETRRTGAVERPPTKQRQNTPTIESPPIIAAPRNEEKRTEPTKQYESPPIIAVPRNEEKRSEPPSRKKSRSTRLLRNPNLRSRNREASQKSSPPTPAFGPASAEERAKDGQQTVQSRFGRKEKDGK